MCKASDLIAYLQTLDPDTEVSVLRFQLVGYGHRTDWKPLDLDEYSDNKELIDWRDSTTGGYAGKQVLFLGED